MKNFYYKIVVIIYLFFVFSVDKTMAALLSPDGKKAVEDRVTKLGSKSYDTNATLEDIVGTVIKGFLGLLGMIFVILIIVGGYNWMTAAGAEEKVTKAKTTISRAIIGLIIVISAYAITYFVFSNLPTGSPGTSGP